MDTTTATPAPATAPAVAAPVAAPAPNPLDALQFQYFAPAELAKAQEAAAKAAELVKAAKLPVLLNFKQDQPFPTGYGIGVIPITRQNEAGSFVTGLVIGAIPDPTTIAAHDKGEAFIRDRVLAYCRNKLAAATRPRKDGSLPASLPLSVEDFIIPQTRDQGMGYIRAVESDYVRKLSENPGFAATLSIKVFRQLLASAAFAKQMYPTVPAERWSGLLDKIIERAAKEGKDAGILMIWKQTRDSATLELPDFDLDDVAAIADEPETA